MAREINTIAVGHDPSQFSLDGLLINGLEVRVLPRPKPFRRGYFASNCVQNDGLRGDFRSGKPVKPTASSGFLERAMRIEPTSEAWEAGSKTLKAIDLAALSFPNHRLNCN